MSGRDNPLWAILLEPENGFLDADGTLSADGLTRFVNQQASIADNLMLHDANGAVIHTKGIALYSGFTGDVYNGNIAVDLSIRSGEQIAVLDRTPRGDFLKSATDADINGADFNIVIDQQVGCVVLREREG